MSQDIVGDVGVAMRIAQKAGLLGGAFGGVKSPPFQTSKFYWPHWLVVDAATMTIAANTLYRCWFYVDATTTFLGGWFANSGTGDSGVVLRIGVWDAAGNLKKDFGVVTLTGAAATKQAANSVTLTPGWYQVGLVSSGTPALYTMNTLAFQSNVGLPSNPLAAKLGSFSIPHSANAVFNIPLGDSASFTYGALPDPITAASTTIFSYLSATTGTFPQMGLYL